MSSFRNYSDTGSYKSRTGIAGGSTFGRNASTGSSFGNYRNTYTGIGSSTSTRTPASKIGSTYGSSFTKKDGDKTEEKPTFKYSSAKNSEKERPISIKTSKDDARPRSRCSNGTPSILEKYNLAANKTTTERPSSVLDRYRGSSRETSHEPDSISSRYSTHSYSESSRSFSNDKKDKEPPVYKGLRATTKASREASPEVSSSKSPAYRTYSRTPIFGKSTSTSNTPEPSSTPLSSRYGNGSTTTSSSRYSLRSSRSNNPERVTATIGYTTAEKFHSPIRPNLREDIPKPQQNESPSNIKQPTNGIKEEAKNSNNDNSEINNNAENKDEEVIVITVVTRGTSPTPPPALTAYTRTRRLEPPPKVVKKEVKKSELNKIETQEQEQQVDEPLKERYSTRYNSGSSRVPWVSSYLDKFGGTATSSSSSYTPRTNYGASHRVTSYGYSRSNENSYSSKDNSTRSTSSLSHEGDHHGRCSSSASSKDNNSRATSIERSSPGPLKKRASEERKLKETTSKEESPRIVEGQDHGQKSSNSNSSRAGSLSRSGSVKASTRHSTSDSVSMPTNCSSSSSSNRSSKQASSASAASMTKIKSAATTTTMLTTSSSSASGSSKNVAGSSLVTTRRPSSPDARKPPVPRPEMVGKNNNMANYGHIKYVNKDFRKSALNMENGDPSRSQITERKQLKKCQRSISLSSQDSQSETNNSDIPATAQQVVSSASSTSLRSNKSKSGTPPTKSNKTSKSTGKDSKRSGSKSPRNNGCVSRTMSMSTSECSSEGSSSESSNSDEEEPPVKPEIRTRRTSDSPFHGKISAGSSRTSILASSTDELQVNVDKPPRPPTSPRSRSDKSGKTDEAKSFLMRALAPVTNLFKGKQQENGAEIRNGGWVEAYSEDSLDKKRTSNLNYTNSEKTTSPNRRTGLARQSSGEMPWWLDPNSDNVPEGVERIPSVANDDASQDTTTSTTLPDDGKFKFKVWRQDSGERAWWLDDNDIPEKELSSLKDPPPPSPPSSKSLNRKDSTRSTRSSLRTRNKTNKLKHQQSGERAWWLSDDPENVPEGVEIIPVSPIVSRKSKSSESSESRPIINKLRHIESGERPWWLDSSAKVPDGVQKLPVETTESNSDDSSESFDKVEIGVSGNDSGTRGLSRFPLEDEPLGDRASPEGIENPPAPPDRYCGRTSPYDNVRQSPARRSSAPRKRPANLPLFIGNHTNIDDLLGDDEELSHSPMMPRNQKPRQEEILDNSSDEECVEIDPTQVIIHDSTPQMPVIQRRHRDNDRPQPDGYIPVREFLL